MAIKMFKQVYRFRSPRLLIRGGDLSSQTLAKEASLPRHRACFRIRSLKGSPGRMVLPNGTYLCWVWLATRPVTAFCPGWRM
jgi:hypothetical protein